MVSMMLCVIKFVSGKEIDLNTMKYICNYMINGFFYRVLGNKKVFVVAHSPQETPTAVIFAGSWSG